jgi:hypothetical protein
LYPHLTLLIPVRGLFGMRFVQVVFFRFNFLKGSVKFILVFNNGLLLDLSLQSLS